MSEYKLLGFNIKRKFKHRGTSIKETFNDFKEHSFNVEVDTTAVADSSYLYNRKVECRGFYIIALLIIFLAAYNIANILFSLSLLLFSFYLIVMGVKSSYQYYLAERTEFVKFQEFIKLPENYVI